MKLSELFNKPFKVKGGGTLNLKGYSKHIIDKEIGSGEITPESITPEMLDDNNFRQRIRLYGHTVEEVEQLIADDKCYKCKGNGEAVLSEEDALYSSNSPIIHPDDHIEEGYIEYILIANDDIASGLLLKKIDDTGDVRTFADVLDTFIINVDNNGIVSCSVGYSSL